MFYYLHEGNKHLFPWETLRENSGSERSEVSDKGFLRDIFRIMDMLILLNKNICNFYSH